MAHSQRMTLKHASSPCKSHTVTDGILYFLDPKHGNRKRAVVPKLTNAPAVFQRLMQQVVTPLNPKSGPHFVSVYVDDILVFSASLEEHLPHLKIVIRRLTEAGLKLKPSKCRFAQKELQLLSLRSRFRFPCLGSRKYSCPKAATEANIARGPLESLWEPLFRTAAVQLIDGTVVVGRYV